MLSTSSEDFARIRQWRQSYIGVNPAHEFDFEWLEVIRDDASYHFGFYQDQVLAGGVRFTPVGHGLTLSERLVNIPELFNQHCSLLDVNRLLVHEDLRGSMVAINALKYCRQWMHDHTIHEGFIALCVPRFVNLYKRVGARLVAEDISVTNLPSKRYSLMSFMYKE
ncbi:MAG TPA: GNAT family N-acetyltransferase [Dongiaceae bacterium]|jgi:hypothetical protein|nr:GNAT family N-acetyltransferase [Dongiaceae bacterium]